PRTILTRVQRLRAGHWASLTFESCRSTAYWTPDFQDTPMDETDALRELDARLDAAVASRMVADVPIGLFLSGGVDSTTVGYYMRRHSDRVKSFSIGFEERAWDESEYATLAARHLGTDHSIE